MVQAVTRAMGSDGERQMKLHLLTRRSPPAVQPGSCVHCYQSAAQGLGTLGLENNILLYGKIYFMYLEII